MFSEYAFCRDLDLMTYLVILILNCEEIFIEKVFKLILPFLKNLLTPVTVSL